MVVVLVWLLGFASLIAVASWGLRADLRQNLKRLELESPEPLDLVSDGLKFPRVGTLRALLTANDVPLSLVLQKGRIDGSIQMRGPLSIKLFPRAESSVVSLLGKGYGRPLFRCAQGLLLLFTFLMPILTLGSLLEESNPNLIGVFLLGVLSGLIPMAFSYVGRVMRRSFPIKVSFQPTPTGDASFDEIFFAKGNEDEILAVLDAETRRMLLAAKEQLAPLFSEGELSFFTVNQAYGEGFHSKVLLGEAVALLSRVAHRLTMEKLEIPEALLANVKADPILDVRRRSLRWLHAKYPKTLAAKEAMEYALESDSQELKALAKTFLRGQEEDALGGQLSVALLPEKQGQLSVPQGEQGQLSVAASGQGLPATAPHEPEGS